MTNPRYHRGRWRGATRQTVLARWGHRCIICGHPGSDGHGKGLHLAHIVEPEHGGSDEPDNLILLCAAHHRGYDAAKQQARRQPPAPAADTPTADYPSGRPPATSPVTHESSRIWSFSRPVDPPSPGARFGLASIPPES